MNHWPTRAIALLVTVLMVTTSYACATGNHDTVNSRTTIDPALSALLQHMSDNITTDYLHSELTNLTTAFNTRYAYAYNHQHVLDWIYNEFKDMGYEPRRWSFVHNGFDHLSNIIVDINGTGSSQFYIVCAHLDTINFSSSWAFPDKSPAPGADDDGSGLVALMAFAKVLHNYRFYYGIRLIAFDVEELDHAVGSTQYAKNITDSGEGLNLKGVLNLDMIGYNPTYIHLDVDYVSNSYNMWTDYIQPANNEFHFITHLDAYLDPNNSSFWGDVDSFWHLGYKGIGFEEAIYSHGNETWYTANPYYHTANDTIDKMNMDLYTRASRLILTTLVWMADPTLPDLSIKNIVLPKAAVYDGDPVRINATVANTGNLNTSNAQLDIIIDSKKVTSMNVSVPAQGSVNISYLWNSTAGQHVIDVVADPNNTIGEWDEENNNASAVLSVLVRPDMALVDFNIVEDHVNSGDMAHLSVKVVNHGPSYIECWLQVKDDRAPTMLVSSELVGLMAGNEWTHLYNWASNINGTHVLDGRLTKCSPGDRNETNDHLSDSILVNGFPVASILVQPTDGALTYQDLEFSGASSSDDLSVSQYYFIFGDGNETGWTSNQFVKHNYTTEGTYNVDLQVKDSLGAPSRHTYVSVKITDRPPVAVITADHMIADTGAPITFTSTDSRDPDGKIVSYNWNILPMGQSSDKPELTVSFLKAGNYTARLIVTDDSGNIGTTSTLVQIKDRAPQAVIAGPTSVQTEDLAHFNAQASSDPDGTIISYYWDFGDGSKSNEVGPSHAYGSPGKYQVTLLVMDNDKSTAETHWNITVSKRPILGKESLTDTGIWVLGACAAVILVFLIYTTVPSRTKPSRPIRKKAKMGRRRKA